MLVQKVGDWKKLHKIAGEANERIRLAKDRALTKEAVFLKNKIQEGIKDQAPGDKPFTPLALSTIAVRQFRNFSHAKALMKSGTLRNSVHVFEEKDSIFIGVRRTKKAGADEVIDLATIHEYGAGPIVIQITAKMRRFLIAAFRAAGMPAPYGRGTGIIISKIPARPFISPIWKKYGGKPSRDRVEAEMQRLLKGVVS